MTDRELKIRIRQAYLIQPSERKAVLTEQYRTRKICFAEILFIQLKYMGLPLAVALGLLLSMFFVAVADTDMRLSAMTSVCLPVIALILLTGLGKSERYKMNELEMSSRFSLRMINALRLMICGITGIFSAITASVMMSMVYHTNLIPTLVSCNALYLAAVSVCIVIIRRWHSDKNIYGCMIGTFCIVLLSLLCNATCRAELPAAVPAAVLLAALIITVGEGYRLMKESEELSWSLC